MPCDCDTQTFWDTPNMSCLVDSNMLIWCLVEMLYLPSSLVMFGYQRVSVKLQPCWSFRSFNDSSKFEYCIKGCQPHWGFGSVAWDVGTPRGTLRLQWPALLITFDHFCTAVSPCQETYLTMTLQFISWVLCLVLFLMVLFICTELLKFVQRVTWIERHDMLDHEVMNFGSSMRVCLNMGHPHSQWFIIMLAIVPLALGLTYLIFYH